MAAPTTTPVYSWRKTLALNFAPGVATVSLSLAIGPVARALGLPSTLGYTAAILFVTLGELAFLRRAAMRETGTSSILGAVSLRRTLGWRRTLWGTVTFVALTAGLFVALAPVAESLDGVFGWLPADLSPTLSVTDVDTFGSSVILSVLLINWLLDAVINAPVEELYWKGHLMDRLPVRGLAAPVVTGVLFASEHFWQPQEFVLVVLIQVSLSIFAWKTRSLGVAIATHVVVNTLVTVLAAISLLT